MLVEALPVAGPASPPEVAGRSWPAQGHWTYEDFLELPDDGNRYEIIDGVLYVAPPPSPQHQDRLFTLCRRVADDADRRQLGKLFVAPIGLLMPGARPVQPDAFFLKTENPARIDWERHVEGTPDLVIEVASPSTAGYDRRQKQDAYARGGVREYWIVDPWGHAVELLLLDPATTSYLSRGIFRGDSHLPTVALAGLPYTVAELLG